MDQTRLRIGRQVLLPIAKGKHQSIDKSETWGLSLKGKNWYSTRTISPNWCCLGQDVGGIGVAFQWEYCISKATTASLKL